ncbi:MAG: protein translocase subunit SecF [Myxococcota bacterium]
MASNHSFFTIIPPNTKFDFVGNSKRFFTLSGGVLVLALLGLVFVRINWGVEFVGGTEIQVKFPEKVDENEIRKILDEAKLEGASVQQFGAPENNEYLLRVERISVLTTDKVAAAKTQLQQVLGDKFLELQASEREGDRLTVYVKGTPMENQPTPDPAAAQSGAAPAPVAITDKTLEPNGKLIEDAVKAAGLELRPHDRRKSIISEDREEHIVFVKGVSSRVMEALRGRFGEKVEERRTDYVDATVAEELRTDGILALLYALGVMLLYIAIRFDFYFSPGAIVALFHDVLVALGVVVWARLDFDLTLVAAFLTIIGYSINDTIVIYDRVREQLTGKEGIVELEDLVNRSVNETLSRTVLTSGATLFVCLALLLFGGRALQGLALALCVGIITGTYSSFAIATPTYLWLKRKFPHGILQPAKG